MSAVAAAANRAAKEKAYEGRDKRGRPPKIQKKEGNRGKCGQYDKEGKFVLCGLPNLPPRSPLFCQQCKRYYHLPCFQATHYC